MERLKISELILVVHQIYRLQGKKEAQLRLREAEAAHGLGRGDLEWVLELLAPGAGSK